MLAKAFGVPGRKCFLDLGVGSLRPAAAGLRLAKGHAVLNPSVLRVRTAKAVGRGSLTPAQPASTDAGYRGIVAPA